MKKSAISRLFAKKTRPLPGKKNISTVPLSGRQAEILEDASRIEPQQLLFCCAQSIGKQREHNEDCLLAISMAMGGEKSNIPFGLFVMADGMGGHQYGEVASAAAARTLSGYLLKNFLPFLLNPSDSMNEPIQDMMHAAIKEAQRAVVQAAPGSGTTLTAVLVLGQQMTIGHVGDSRAYIIPSYGGGKTLTRDHSLVKRLEELGQISSEEAASHPQRNVLYRALGQGDTLEPDIFTAPFPQNGYLLLCSDGLWSVLPEENIFNIVLKAKNLKTACQELVSAANEAGGPDNISVILTQLI